MGRLLTVTGKEWSWVGTEKYSPMYWQQCAFFLGNTKEIFVMQEAWLSSDTLPTNVNIQISCVITRYPPLESVPYPPHENAEIDTFS